ncbi:MAG TPA: ROK family protein [Microlunatus sp.]
MSPRAARKRTTRDIRSASRFAVLRGLYTLGMPTRQELAALTGLSFATIANVVNELLGIGMLVEAGREDSNGGRPRARLRIAHERGLLIGVDVAETYVHADVFDSALTRISRHEHPISDPADVLDEIVDILTEAIGRHPGVEVLGAGISMPGQVEPLTGVSVFAPNWGWSDVPVQQLLQERLTVPIHVDNPLKATTVAELWFGHGREVDNLVTINLGTGVGAGIVIDGQLIRGVTNNAGEWGHTTLIMDGRACRCGRRGCVEAYTGVPGIRDTLADLAPDHPWLTETQAGFIAALADGLAAGDPTAQAVVARLSYDLGAALANVVNMINPERIVLTSWTADQLGGWLLEPTRARMTAEAISGSADVVDLVLSSQESPVALGMATLVLESFLQNAGLPSPTNAPLARDH